MTVGRDADNLVGRRSNEASARALPVRGSSGIPAAIPSTAAPSAISDLLAFLTSTPNGAPRTAGIVGIGHFHRDITDLARRLGPLSLRRGAAASGKVVLVDTVSAELRVFQCMPDGAVTVAWCGNATLAGMKAIGVDEVTVIGPQGRSVRARVNCGASKQRLEWAVLEPPSRPVRLEQGGAESWILNNFNMYVLAIGSADFTLPKVDGGNAKVVALDLSTPLPTARVRVASGWHGAVPLTAGAELVLATLYLPRLADALTAGAVQTLSGDVEQLPDFVGYENGYAITFPTRLVSFEHISRVLDDA